MPRTRRTSTDGAKRLAYSVSSLMIYEVCPRQYYYTFIRGIPPPRTRAMEVGTNIHSLISRHLKRHEEPPVNLEPDTRKMLDDFKSSRFNLQPVASEKPFTLPFERGDVRGRIDLILPGRNGGYEVVDFKSGSARSREELDPSLQLPLYTLAAARLYEIDLHNLAYTYYFLRDGAEISFTPTPQLARALTGRVEDILASIQAGKFQPAEGCHCYACEWHRRWRGSSAVQDEAQWDDVDES